MTADLAAPPVLSTPDDRMLEARGEAGARRALSGEALRATYEVARTAAEIRAGGWLHVALQFPDGMLVDAPGVVDALRRELRGPGAAPARRLHILADTSYSACCVDEVAAEHADAQVVVHYGRTCLSPTSRLPVVYVYTRRELDHAAAARALESELGELGDAAARAAAVVVMADLTLHHHVDGLAARLRAAGHANVVATDVVRDPAAVIPNRRTRGLDLDADAAKACRLVHVGDAPPSLLLALHSRFASLHVVSAAATPSPERPSAQTAGLLRRRFARVASLASAGVIGILVHTLSVSNYLSSLDALRDKIARAGKKSYTVVVGKLNPAKLANFAEVEGWVVVGCWESALVEDDGDYWRPVVTPFELEAALTSDEERTWGGEWWGGTEKLRPPRDEGQERAGEPGEDKGPDGAGVEGGVEGGFEGAESLPPVFDLRTGRLVGHSTPMRLAARSAGPRGAASTGLAGGRGADEERRRGTVVTRAAGDVATIRGVASPGAEFLRSQRTWQGLGSDFDDGATTGVDEGRSGIARGYRVGEGGPRR